MPELRKAQVGGYETGHHSTHTQVLWTQTDKVLPWSFEVSIV